MFPEQVINLVNDIISTKTTNKENADNNNTDSNEDKAADSISRSVQDIKITLLTLDSDRFNLAKNLVRFFALLLRLANFYEVFPWQ